LQSIGASARQHLVDADDVIWVSAHTEMETFLAGNFDEIPVGLKLAAALSRNREIVEEFCILVGANTGGF
jgi:hypothetical protein